MPLAFFIGKAIDIHGAFGVPGTGEKMGGAFWGALVVALVAGYFFVRSLVKPRIVEGSWAPTTHVDVGDFTAYATNNRARVNYVYLTSHPSYALLLLLTAPIPAAMAAMTINEGDSTFYWRVTGIVGLIILACMALARILAWYVFRFGRKQLDYQLADLPVSPGRMGWQIAWKPVLMLVVLMYAIATPVPGVLVVLDTGGQALLLAESMTVADFRGVMNHVENGDLHATGKVIDEITDDQRQYYGFDIDAFGQPPADGRVMMLLSYP